MITGHQALELQRTLRWQRRGDGHQGPLADALTSLYSIACELTDVDDISQACNDLVDEAMRARHEADKAVIDEQRDMEDARADDQRDERMPET